MFVRFTLKKRRTKTVKKKKVTTAFIIQINELIKINITTSGLYSLRSFDIDDHKSKAINCL